MYIENMSWTTPTIMSSTFPIARYGHTLFMHDGHVYCFGGKGRPGVVLSDLWRLDPGKHALSYDGKVNKG